MIGYVANTGSGKPTVHFVEVGILKTRYIMAIHPVASILYFSNELAIDKHFIWGPKLGGFVAAAGFLLGAEVICYTDFQSSSLRLAPLFGFGFYQFKLYGSPHILLSEGSFAMNQGNVGLTISPFTFKKERIK